MKQWYALYVSLYTYGGKSASIGTPTGFPVLMKQL